jgi:hypothetical protein
VIENSSRRAFLLAANSAPRPGDFHLGSAASRAAARMLLKARKTAAEQHAERPPDVRIVFDIPRHVAASASAEFARYNRVNRYINGDEIVEMIFPAYEGECLGVCAVSPDVSVEEALQQLRKMSLGR